jgi:hypothetical protein
MVRVNKEFDMEEKLKFFKAIRSYDQITLQKIIRLAKNNPEKAIEWLCSDEADGPNGVSLQLREDVVDGSDPCAHPEAIWGGQLSIENNAFYWSGAAGGTGFSAKRVKTRVHLHSVFEIV